MKIDRNDFLRAVNGALESQLEYVRAGQRFPSFFVIGSPRSGTTLLTQVLTFLTDVRYIDNLSAAFWAAPEVGALLSNKLIKQRAFSGVSTFGRTKDVSEPHEFGAFWRKYLDYPDTAQIANHSVRWGPLLERLDNISDALNGPVLYKVFQLAWHLAEFHAQRPDTRWIRLTRDEAHNVQSIMRYREALGIDDAQWASVKPLASAPFDAAPALVKCASQVVFINRWIDEQLAKIPRESYVEVTLEALCADPEETVAGIGHFLGVSFDASRLPEVFPALRSHTSDADLTSARHAIKAVRAEEVF